MKLNELQYEEGARKSNYRIGRGPGSGNGKTAGKGHKGQNARSGGGVALGFEGGQTKIFRRLAKRGFTNYTRKEYAIINVELLNAFENGAEVTPAILKETGLVKQQLDGIRVLGNGKLEKALTVKANKFSKTAIEAIEAAGGKAEVI